MAVNNPRQDWFEFGGLNLSGNPLNRPPRSASHCDNFRLMPGGALRMRSGRTARMIVSGAQRVLQLMPIRYSYASGYQFHCMEVAYPDSTAQIRIVGLSSPWGDGGVVETLNAEQDENGTTTAKAWAHLPSSIVYYNALGYRAQDTLLSFPWSFPALSQFPLGGTPRARYFGLYPTIQSAGGKPTVTVAPGSGFNKVANSVRLFVGVYNSATDHYSNTIELDTLTAFSGPATVTINDLDRIQVPFHDTAERDELYWVFYATDDDFQVGYRMLDANNEPLKLAFTAGTSISLSIADGTKNGWYLDTQAEMPVENYPPRRMSALWFVGSRLYGLLNPSTVPANSIEYKYSEKDLAGVVWSHAEGSVRTKQYVGDPLQSWPASNFSPTPSAERPLAGAASPSNTESVLLCPNSSWLLTEAADGLHEWTPINLEHGLINQNPTKMVAITRHGLCWVTQRRQIAMYTNDGELKILSSEYDAVLRDTYTYLAATYVYDPRNFVDRFQVFFHDGSNYRSLCHDFNLGAYTTTEVDEPMAAATLRNASGQAYHVVAAGTAGSRCGLYTVEGHPDFSGRVPCRDQTYAISPFGNINTTEIPDAYWHPNFLRFGDATVRAEKQEFLLTGDAAPSQQLSTASPLTVEWFGDFRPLIAGTSPQGPITPEKATQVLEDALFRVRLNQGNASFWRFIFRMRGHSQDFGLSFYPDYAYEGGNAIGANFYGSIMAWHVGPVSALNQK